MVNGFVSRYRIASGCVEICTRSSGRAEALLLLFYTLDPIAGATFCMHHSYDPDAIGLIQEHKRIGEFSREGPLRRRMKSREPIRVAADFLCDPLYFSFEPVAQIAVDQCVKLNRAEKFLARCRMEYRSLHRARMRFARANSSSAGIPWTLPVWISSTRRLISAFHAASVSGSLACKSSVSRPTSSPTLSGGHWRTSSIIWSNVIGITEH